MNNPGYGVRGYGSGGYGNPPIETLPIGYYLNLLTSQYRNSKKLNALLYMLLKKFDDVSQCMVTMDTAFDLDYAVGPQLDALGQVVGVGRTVGFQPTSVTPISVSISAIQATTYSPRTPGQWTAVVVTLPGAAPVIQAGTLLTFNGLTNYTQLNGVTLEWQPLVYPPVSTNQILLSWPNGDTTFYPQAPDTGTLTSPTLNISPILDDDTYRILIKARIGWNQWDGTIDSLYSLWQNLFPGGSIVILDNQNMTAAITLTGTFTSIVKDLITNGYIIPRPEGVEYTFEFGVLPYFGFGSSPGFIAGFGEGHWAG